MDTQKLYLQELAVSVCNFDIKKEELPTKNEKASHDKPHLCHTHLSNVHIREIRNEIVADKETH